MPRATATGKLNLALVVGPRRDGGKHEVVTVLQRIDLADRIRVEPSARTRVSGFAQDTIVRTALERLSREAGVPGGFAATIVKRVPVAAGLGGGSSDAATALRLANELLPAPLAAPALEQLAAELGADVPFFLRSGPQLGEGDGSSLRPLDLPQDYWVALWLPTGAEKASTAAVYERFDERSGEEGFEARRAALLDALGRVGRAADLDLLPGNDLARSPLAEELRHHGAFRADVSGAGPILYGLFLHRRQADAAAAALRPRGRTWVCAPCWYG
jgi:4-diphosphocytidyl-2-C-methyl-D-erythritol kinase